MKQSGSQKTAILRTCASCEWIFRYPSGASKHPHSTDWDCPKCGWVSYGARFVYGNKAYRYEDTQHPWFEKKMANYATELFSEIINDPARKRRKKKNRGFELEIPHVND